MRGVSRMAKCEDPSTRLDKYFGSRHTLFLYYLKKWSTKLDYLIPVRDDSGTNEINDFKNYNNYYPANDCSLLPIIGCSSLLKTYLVTYFFHVNFFLKFVCTFKF